jgi:dienelactone hydrolase
VPVIKILNTSDTLVVAVTGYGNKLSLPVDDFFKKSGLEYASRIVISDTTKMKTLAGVYPDFVSFDDLLLYIKSVISENNYKSLIVTGVSAGAHTALLLGHLLDADQVVAFAPYPYLSYNEVKRQKDPILHSHKKMLAKFNELPESIKKNFDLAKVLNRWNGITEYYIHVSRYNKIDYKRATYLSGLPKVYIITHPYKEHAVASMLSHDSLLKKCFSLPFYKDNIFKEGYLNFTFKFSRFTQSLMKIIT